MINENIQLGVINTLKINRLTDPGIYLEAADEEVVLLPNCYVTEDMNIGDTIDVFIYTDSDDRLVATTETPLGFKDQFAAVNVVDIIKFGAFVDIGLQKDLLVPRNRQKTPFEIGEKRIIRIVEDEKTNRLIGVEKITSFLSKDIKALKINQEVELLVFAKTPLGFKAIVDNNYEGLIYKNEIFTDIEVCDKIKGYVKKIRDDGKLDLSLQPIGKNISTDINTTKILDLLKNNDGSLPYNYKTDPQTIQSIFAMSKKAYKRALTTLIEENKIKLDENGIRL